MAVSLEGKRIGIIATDFVERVELVDPRDALECAGATTELISIARGSIRTVDHHDGAGVVGVDRLIGDVSAEDYDGLLLPGGVANPDRLRTDAEVIGLIRELYAAGKPIAAICHGPWLLVEADLVRDLTLTSWPSLKTDIRNAGGIWVDREVVSDRGIVTSRNPDDIPAFDRAMIEEFSLGVRERPRPEAASVR